MNANIKVTRSIEDIVKLAIQKAGTRIELSRILKVHERTIYRWKSGEVKPNSENMLDLMNFIQSSDKLPKA